MKEETTPPIHSFLLCLFFIYIYRDEDFTLPTYRPCEIIVKKRASDHYPTELIASFIEVTRPAIITALNFVFRATLCPRADEER